MLLTHYLVIYIRPFPLSLPHSPSIHLDIPTSAGVPKCTSLFFWVPACLDHDLVFSSQSMVLRSKRGLRAMSWRNPTMKTNIAKGTRAAERTARTGRTKFACRSLPYYPLQPTSCMKTIPPAQNRQRPIQIYQSRPILPPRMRHLLVTWEKNKLFLLQKGSFRAH